MAYTNAQIDSLVKKLGDYVENNYKELINPDHSVLRSGLAIIFRAAVNGTGALYKAAEANGIQVTKWHETLDKIVAATEARGSEAADKIKKVTQKTKTLDNLYKDFKIGNRFNDGWKKIRIAKQNLPDLYDL